MSGDRLRIAIVGDSFGVQDPHFGPTWSSQLEQAWPGQVINLCYPGASNFGILMQIERALSLRPDFIIHHATSSVRTEIRLRDQTRSDWLHRVINQDRSDHTRDLLSTTWFTANVLGQMTREEEQQFVAYHQRFTDLDTEILKNYYWIRMGLELMRASGHGFCWNQGGFEHARFASSRSWDFGAYEQYRSSWNPWDHIDSDRCWHHIESADIHLSAFQLYNQQILETCRG